MTSTWPPAPAVWSPSATGSSSAGEATVQSALFRKSVTDLTRRKARTAFAVLTLAIAVASVGIFSLASLSDQMMQREIRASRLADVTVDTRPLQLSAGQLAALGALPNVRAVEARSFFATRGYLGGRRVKT